MLELILLIWSYRHTCPSCGVSSWREPPAQDGELSVGKEVYVCLCGAKWTTGNREWMHLSPEERKKYLWSGTLIVPIVTTTLAAIGGYLVRWHEPYWMMAVFFGVLGLIAGLICSSFLWLKRGLYILKSIRRTRDLVSHLTVAN